VENDKVVGKSERGTAATGDPDITLVDKSHLRYSFYQGQRIAVASLMRTALNQRQLTSRAVRHVGHRDQERRRSVALIPRFGLAERSLSLAAPRQ
jgi:hypothetical protein